LIISAGRGRTLWHLRSLTPFGAFRIDKPAPRKWWYRILLVVCLCSKKVGDSSVSSTSTTVGDGRLRLRKSHHDDVIVSRDHARDVLDRMATRFATQQVLELPMGYAMQRLQFKYRTRSAATATRCQTKSLVNCRNKLYNESTRNRSRPNGV